MPPSSASPQTRRPGLGAAVSSAAPAVTATRAVIAVSRPSVRGLKPRARPGAGESGAGSGREALAWRSPYRAGCGRGKHAEGETGPERARLYPRRPGATPPPGSTTRTVSVAPVRLPSCAQALTPSTRSPICAAHALAQCRTGRRPSDASTRTWKHACSVAPRDGVAPGDGLGRQGALVFGMHGGLLRLRAAVEESLTRMTRTANPWTPQYVRWPSAGSGLPASGCVHRRSRSKARSVAPGRPKAARNARPNPGPRLYWRL